MHDAVLKTLSKTMESKTIRRPTVNIMSHEIDFFVKRHKVRSLVFQFIKEINISRTCPDPLLDLCLLFYDMMHYIDFTKQSLQKWISADAGTWMHNPHGFRAFEKATDGITYRAAFLCESEKHPDCATAGIHMSVPSSIEAVHIYGEVYLNDTLLHKGHKKMQKKGKTYAFWGCYPGQLMTSELKEMDSVCFRIYIEFLQITPKMDGDEVNKQIGYLPSDLSAECRFIRLKKSDSFEWILSSDEIKEMNESGANKTFFSPNFGHDDNWCLGFVPHPKLEGGPGLQYFNKFVAIKVMMMRMPSRYKSLGAELHGALEWETEQWINGELEKDERSHSLRRGRWTFDGTYDASQFVPIGIEELRRISKMKMTMNLRVVKVVTDLGDEYDTNRLAMELL